MCVAMLIDTSVHLCRNTAGRSTKEKNECEDCASDQGLIAYGFILQYSVIIYICNEVPDQTMLMCRLIWAFVVGNTK